MPLPFLDIVNLDTWMQVRTEDGRLLGAIPRVSNDDQTYVNDANGAIHEIRILGMPCVCITSFEGFKLSDLPGFERFAGAPSDAELSRTLTGKDPDIGKE